jgi:hypothetical protein
MAQDGLFWRTAYEAYLGSTKETWSEFDLSESNRDPLWPAPRLAGRISDARKPK